MAGSCHSAKNLRGLSPPKPLIRAAYDYSGLSSYMRQRLVTIGQTTSEIRRRKKNKEKKSKLLRQIRMACRPAYRLRIATVRQVFQYNLKLFCKGDEHFQWEIPFFEVHVAEIFRPFVMLNIPLSDLPRHFKSFKRVNVPDPPFIRHKLKLLMGDDRCV